MEYRIRKAPGVCDYTGAQTDFSIKLYDVNGGESGWMSLEVLMEATQVLGAVAGRPSQLGPNVLPRIQIQRQVPNPYGEMDEEVEDEVPPPIAATVSLKDKVNLEAFREACLELQKDPPPNAKGEQDGVAEAHIRVLVSRWKGRFRDPKILYSTVQQVFGVPRERFDLMI